MDHCEDQLEARLNDSLFPREMAVSYWVAMQSAKEFVHRQSQPLREKATIEVIEQLRHGLHAVHLRAILYAVAARHLR